MNTSPARTRAARMLGIDPPGSGYRYTRADNRMIDLYLDVLRSMGTVAAPARVRLALAATRVRAVHPNHPILLHPGPPTATTPSAVLALVRAGRPVTVLNLPPERER